MLSSRFINSVLYLKELSIGLLNSMDKAIYHLASKQNGWHSFNGFSSDEKLSIHYPFLIAKIKLGLEDIWILLVDPKEESLAYLNEAVAFTDTKIAQLFVEAYAYKHIEPLISYVSSIQETNKQMYVLRPSKELESFLNMVAVEVILQKTLPAKAYEEEIILDEG